MLLIEEEKRMVDGQEVDYDVQKINFNTAHKASIEALNPESAAKIYNMLSWCIIRLRLNFTIKQQVDWLKTPTKMLEMEGSLSAGFHYLQGNGDLMSQSTHEKLINGLKKLGGKVEESKQVENHEEKENPQQPRLGS